VAAPGANAPALWPQLISWAATYALVLHSFLAAAILPKSISDTAGDTAQTFVICAHDAASFPTSQDTPAGGQDCQVHCMLTVVGGLFAVAPKSVAAGTFESDIVSVRWSVADDSIGKGARLIHERARAPPLVA
jgi:hypothetical protein